MSSGVMYQCLSTSPQEEKEFKCVERGIKGVSTASKEAPDGLSVKCRLRKKKLPRVSFGRDFCPLPHRGRECP